MPAKLLDALNDLSVRQAKPGPKPRKLADGRGLFLLVTPQGAKHWRLKYSFAGKERLLALGEYPSVGLAEARRRRDTARDEVSRGIDPVQSKRERKAEAQRNALQTFAVVADEWIATRSKSRKWTEAHADQTRQSLREYVLPKLGRLPVAAITAPDVVGVLRPLETAGKLETLRRVRQRVGGVLGYAVATGRRVDNPVRELRDAFVAPQREHFAAIKVAELPKFLADLAGYRGHASTKAIIWMILWTACRTGEVRGARVGEFDLDAGIWTIPAPRMKKRRPHVVPLPSQAVEMLLGLPAFAEGESADGLAFPSPGTVAQQASENVVLQALDKMGYRGRLTGHGLRSLVATALEESDYPADLVKAQLSHSKSNLTDAAYLRGIRLEQRKPMLQWWADRLADFPETSSARTLRAA
jgi:integrase